MEWQAQIQGFILLIDQYLKGEISFSTFHDRYFDSMTKIVMETPEPVYHLLDGLLGAIDGCTDDPVLLQEAHYYIDSQTLHQRATQAANGLRGYISSSTDGDGNHPL